MGIKSKLKKGLVTLLATAMIGCSAPKLRDINTNHINSEPEKTEYCATEKQKYEFAFDRLKSPEIGAKNITSVNNLQSRIFDSAVKPKNAGTRALKHLVWNNLIASWLAVFQHEYFGHCFTYRDLFDDEGGFVASPFYGVSYGKKKLEDMDKKQQQIYIGKISDRITSAGGFEANRILNKNLRTKMFNGNYSVNDAMLYLHSKSCFPEYVSRTPSDKVIKRKIMSLDYPAYDVIDYIESFNTTLTMKYHKNISKKEFIYAAVFHCIDPFLVKSIIDQYDYIANGKEIQKSFNNFPFSCSASLTPAGIEYILEIYGQDKEVYIRAGKNSSGLGFKLTQPINTEFADKIGFSADLFNQNIDSEEVGPVTGYASNRTPIFESSEKERKHLIGCGVGLEFSKQIQDSINLNLGVYAKDKGYIGGKSFFKGVEATVGLEVDF